MREVLEPGREGIDRVCVDARDRGYVEAGGRGQRDADVGVGP